MPHERMLLWVVKKLFGNKAVDKVRFGLTVFTQIDAVMTFRTPLSL